MKGQILVFEQVLIFAIGIAIFISSFAFFHLYQNYYLGSTAEDQLSQIKEYVISHITRLCKIKEMNASVVLTIPKTVGENFYRIKLYDEGLNLTIEPDKKVYVFSSLSYLNSTFNFSGSVISSEGKIVLYKRGDTIILEAP